MAKVTKLSVSLPSELADALRLEAAKQGIPVSQLLAETLYQRTRAADFRQSLAAVYGPITDTDREAGRQLLAGAKSADEILDAD